MKVYVVEIGDYSSKEVVGVFTSQELAHKCILFYGDKGKCEQYELDAMHPKYKEGYNLFDVFMYRDGMVSEINKVNPDRDEDEGFYILPQFSSKGRQLVGTVFAPNKEIAAKITNEKRIQMIAFGEWPIEAIPKRQVAPIENTEDELTISEMKKLIF